MKECYSRLFNAMLDYSSLFGMPLEKSAHVKKEENIKNNISRPKKLNDESVNILDLKTYQSRNARKKRRQKNALTRGAR